MSLYLKLSQSIKLGQERKAELVRAIDDGSAFFADFNRRRMELAFSLFSEDMKKALFEILFFLHVNDPKYEKVEYQATKILKDGARVQEVTETEVACLYSEDCLHGVEGIDRLDPIFQEQFKAFIQQEFGEEVKPKQGFCTFYSIASLGSIGTVGHKVTASDLDLQVQYELSDFLYTSESLSDEKLFEYARQIIQLFAKRWARAKNYKNKDLSNPKIKAQMTQVGTREFQKRFKDLHVYLLQKQHPQILQKCNDLNFAKAMVHEIIDMVKFYVKHCTKAEQKLNEDKMQARIHRIQAYIQQKYPKAEVYLFSYSNDDYRAGRHGTTLESKEASGSAYELILNYEVLMPGIQFTPMIPIHFVMPASVNSARPMYERLVDYIRFHFTDIYDPLRGKLVDLGSTPALTLEYMMAHSGAVYWESFKASSGNLPKATLNLLRLEMLYDQRFNNPVIELIKQPHALDKFIGEALDKESSPMDDFDPDEDFFADYGLLPTQINEDEAAIGNVDLQGGLSVLEIVKMEESFPFLLIDPWWIRFKALKMGFGAANKNVEDQKERELISQIIDMGFALHVKIADVFKVEKPKTLREQVLKRFYAKAFPGKRGEYLRNIFAGEVKTVTQFERDLKTIFKRSMARVQKIVEVSGGEDKSNRDEFRIWYHYYQKYFEPPPQVVRQDILSHLKVARGRLQVGFNEKSRRWFFKSIQKGTKLLVDDLATLPDEVEIMEHRSLLYGIAHCVMNGYYGIYNRGTLMENRTSIELAVGKMKLGKPSSDKYCYITPDSVVRLVDLIDVAFPAQAYDYRDCIFKKSEVVDVCICLNLLEYGNLDILYRTNMKIWAVDSFYHPQVEAQAEQLYMKPEELFGHPKLIDTLVAFFKKHEFALTEENFANITFWCNPHSAIAPGSTPKVKEEYLSKKFREVTLKALHALAPSQGSAESEASEEGAEVAPATDVAEEAQS